MKRHGILVCAFVFFLMTAFLIDTGAQQGGLQTQPGPTRKIVVFQDSFVSVTAQELLVHAHGGFVNKRLKLINGMSVFLPAQAVTALEARAEVKRVDEDLTIHAIDVEALAPVKTKGKPTPTPQPPQSISWGVIKVGAIDAWSYSTGAYVNVAVVDTGIQLNHPDLTVNIAGGINTINLAKTPNDDNGHGTHVAGIAGAVNNTIGVVGVAPRIRLYAVKALNKSGSGFLSDLIEGLQWCIDNHMKVVNMSLGSSSDNQSFHDAITKVYTAGIVQVAAAGNNGGGYGTRTGLVDYPARYNEVIAVSASDINNQFAVFSSAGPEVDLIAPGVSINSTYMGSTYKVLSGTSMASPFVAAVAALRLQLHPGESPDAVKAVLQNNAVNVGLPSTQQGAGLVNAFAVVITP